MKLNPWVSFVKANLYLILGRFRFPRDRIGEVVEEDGQKFIIFRQMLRYPESGESCAPQAIFKVRFHLATMSPSGTRYPLSLRSHFSPVCPVFAPSCGCPLSKVTTWGFTNGPQWKTPETTLNRLPCAS